MGTTHQHWLGTEELLAMGSFLVTVALGAWLLPGAWLSGAVVGLGIGLIVAAAVHLHAVRVALPALMGRVDAERRRDDGQQDAPDISTDISTGSAQPVAGNRPGGRDPSPAPQRRSA